MLPKVFANGKGEFSASQIPERGFFSRLKIASFIKHIVSRQKNFIGKVDDCLVLNEGRAVIEIFFRIYGGYTEEARR